MSVDQEKCQPSVFETVALFMPNLMRRILDKSAKLPASMSRDITVTPIFRGRYWSWLILLITASFVFVIGATRPSYNWDIIGYVASAYHREGLRGQELASRTFGEIREEVDDQTFAELTSGPYDGEYRGTVYRDPVALEQHIPFFSIRVAYVESVRLLSKFGLTYAKATYILASLFAALSTIVLAGVLRRLNISMLALPVIVLSTGFIDLARFSTPDAMACFAALLAVYLNLRNSRLALLLVALIPLIRTDFVLLSVFMCIFEFRRGNRLPAILSLSAAVIAYLVVNAVSGNYGWLNIFNFALIKTTPYPANLTPSSSIGDYAWAYAVSAFHLVSHSHFVVYALAVFVLLLRGMRTARDTNAMLLAVVPLLFVGAHLLLFPAYMHRFFVFAAALVFAWVLHEGYRGRLTGAIRQAERA